MSLARRWSLPISYSTLFSTLTQTENAKIRQLRDRSLSALQTRPRQPAGLVVLHSQPLGGAPLVPLNHRAAGVQAVWVQL